MRNYKKVKEFASHYYKDKDIMHDLSHIDRVIAAAENIEKDYNCDFDIIHHAAYFHGFIYREEDKIREWLIENEYRNEEIEKIVKAAWESQKDKEAKSIEGMILHDAHMIEGGRTFLIVKSLITGSVRGQSLEETISYIENNIVGKGSCYTKRAKKIHKTALEFTEKYIEKLKNGLYIDT